MNMNVNIAVKRIEVAPAKEKYQAIITHDGAPVGVTSPIFDAGDMEAAGHAMDILFMNVVHCMHTGRVVLK